MDLDTPRKPSKYWIYSIRLLRQWRDRLRDPNPLVMARLLREMQAIAEANTTTHMLQRIQLREKLSAHHGWFELETLRPALHQFRFPLRGQEDRRSSRLPVPAFAASVLPGGVADPPAGELVRFQVKQDVVPVGQADDERLG